MEQGKWLVRPLKSLGYGQLGDQDPFSRAYLPTENLNKEYM